MNLLIFFATLIAIGIWFKVGYIMGKERGRKEAIKDIIRQIANDIFDNSKGRK